MSDPPLRRCSLLESEQHRHALRIEIRQADQIQRECLAADGQVTQGGFDVAYVAEVDLADDGDVRRSPSQCTGSIRNQRTGRAALGSLPTTRPWRLRETSDMSTDDGPRGPGRTPHGDARPHTNAPARCADAAEDGAAARCADWPSCQVSCYPPSSGVDCVQVPPPSSVSTLGVRASPRGLSSDPGPNHEVLDRRRPLIDGVPARINLERSRAGTGARCRQGPRDPASRVLRVAPSPLLR